MPAKVTSRASEYRVIDRFPGGVGWIAHPEETMQRASHALVADGTSGTTAAGNDGGGDAGSGADGESDVDAESGVDESGAGGGETEVGADRAVWVVDPVDAAGIDELIAEYGTVAGVVVLSSYHRRDADALARRHGVAVHLPRDMRGVAAELHAPVERFDGALADTGYELLAVSTRPGWQEFALYDGTTLVASDSVGTAPVWLTGAERLGVLLLVRPFPPRAAFAGLEPDRILVGHGAGVFEDAAGALADALAGSRRRFPRALVENGRAEARSVLAALCT
ncbi:hypothetical protein BRC90_05655 [Halobacteriales archaeon QS_4_69_34]|nr:MAG: hypothetical protein BRC90_05655 [Halobacteriales archaeon QS_4_69_34]